MEQKEFELYFKHLCIDLGISQTKAAEIMGMSQQALWAQIQRGTVRFAAMETLLNHFGKSYIRK